MNCKTCQRKVTKIASAGHRFNQVFKAVTEPRVGGGGRVLPYMCYIGMCSCEGYGFQAVYSGIGYKNQRVWV